MAVTFTNPEFLLLLILLPVFLFMHFFSLRYVKKRGIRLANFEALRRMTGGVRIYTNWMILVMRLLVILSLVMASSGMIYWYTGQSSDTTYILAIDASGSMLADDFDPNRLQAAKAAARLFIDSVQGQATIGIVSFSGIAQIEKAPSESKLELRSTIDNIDFKSIHGTAIGDALKLSIQLLSTIEGPKTVILLTDGQENVVSKSELTKVIEIANDEQITVSTIGIGSNQGGIIPGLELTSTIDENLLQGIASQTNGQYFRVENERTLAEVYESLAETSETQIPIKLRLPLLFLCLLLLFVEWGLLNTKFKSVP